MGHLCSCNILGFLMRTLFIGFRSQVILRQSCFKILHCIYRDSSILFYYQIWSYSRLQGVRVWTYLLGATMRLPTLLVLLAHSSFPPKCLHDERSAVPAMFVDSRTRKEGLETARRKGHLINCTHLKGKGWWDGSTDEGTCYSKV